MHRARIHGRHEAAIDHDRRKRIEARLDSQDGTERISALKMWFKHMQKAEPRAAVLALWEDPVAFEALWDKLQREYSDYKIVESRKKMNGM